MKSRITAERLVFYVSLIVLAFAYGWGARAFGWIPDEHLERAASQALRVFGPKPYLAPQVYERSGVRWLDSAADVSGLVLIATRSDEDHRKQALQLVDRAGNLRHQWTIDPESLGQFTDAVPSGVTVRSVEERPLHGFHLFPGGDVIVNLEYYGTVRLDACSQIEWFVAEGNHHSIEPGGDGAFWVGGSTSEPRTTTEAYPKGYPGLDEPVYLDYLLLVTGDGRVIRRLSVLDILYDNGLEHHIFKSEEHRDPDVTHLNDVEPLPARLAEDFPGFAPGDLLVSLRNLDMILVLDPTTGVVKWHATEPFIAQHDPDFLAGGWIGVFDNNRDDTSRGTALGGSRIVAIKPGSDSTRVLFPTQQSDPFYTEIMGKWQQLEAGNMLLTESRAGRIVEAAPDGRGLWEWVAPSVDGRKVPEVSEGYRVSVTLSQVRTWPCNDGSQ